MRTQWQTVDIGVIVAQYVDGLIVPSGIEIIQHDWYLDQVKGIVVLRLFVDDIDAAPEGTA